jgi:transglutaminase-like putative cysteine protease
MLLEIQHETRYSYSAPIRESVMELWMQPRSAPGQRLVSFDVATEPKARCLSYIDWLGNTVLHFNVPEEHETLVIRTSASVETRPPDAAPAAVSPEEWDRLGQEWVRDRYFDFLHPSKFVADTEHLSRFVEEHAVERLDDPLSSLRRLNDLMYGAFEYTPGFTAADSPIDASLAHRKGVCQDFAHIMLTVCRSWGVPARYVSGYLLNAHAAKERSNPDATHAWIECFLPSLGWIGFDPTNDTLTAERHVAVAIGRDYADVPPSRGVFKGVADSLLAVEVSVKPAKQASVNRDFLRLSPPPRLTPRRQTSGSHGLFQQ